MDEEDVLSSMQKIFEEGKTESINLSIYDLESIRFVINLLEESIKVKKRSEIVKNQEF